VDRFQGFIQFMAQGGP